MKYFFIYPLIGAIDGIMLVLARYLKMFPKEYGFIFDNYSIIFHFSFLSFFIFKNIEKTGILKYYTSFIIGYSLLLFYVLQCNDIKKYNGLAYGIANTGLLLICLLYFTQLSKKTSDFISVGFPSYWIINGIFCGMSISIPVTFTINYLLKYLSPELFYLVIWLAPFAYIVMHIFFIKAYLSIINTKNI